ENRVADNLSRPVIRNVAAASRVAYFDPAACKQRVACGDVRSAAAPHAERDHRGMLEEKKKIRNTAGTPLLDERLLHVERLAVRNDAEPADFQRSRVRCRVQPARVSSRWRQTSPVVPSRRP